MEFTKYIVALLALLETAVELQALSQASLVQLGMARPQCLWMHCKLHLSNSPYYPSSCQLAAFSRGLSPLVSLQLLYNSPFNLGTCLV